MKVAIEFKTNADKIKEELEKQGFECSSSCTSNTIWVYNLLHLEYFTNMVRITRPNDFRSYDFSITNITYIEVDKEN